MYGYAITARNVNEAIGLGVMLFTRSENVRKVAPRGESTLEFKGPVMTIYNNPLERVLFHPLRDANPFFHFFESLWVLAGRDDVEWVQHFLPRIKEYSDDGTAFHGAYGARLRHVQPPGGVGFESIDQLASAIQQLTHEHGTRRAACAMWQPDLDSGYAGKDMPCNMAITFKIRDDHLNMTVFNRSNDMLWGLYGANVVQFSTIMEYVAAMVGVRVGAYAHISDSFHIYDERADWQRCKDISLVPLDPYSDSPYHYSLLPASVTGAYPERVQPESLIKKPEIFDTELEHFCNYLLDRIRRHEYVVRADYENTFLDRVAVPLFNAHMAHKLGRHYDAAAFTSTCTATDWQLAARLWLHRRAHG